MGNWNITIRGVGCHHNDARATDANRMAAEFVQKLRDAGHTVSHANITFGGEDDLTAPKRYLDERKAAGGEPREARCARPVRARLTNQSDADDGMKPCRLVVDHEGGCEPPVELVWQ